MEIFWTSDIAIAAIELIALSVLLIYFIGYYRKSRARIFSQIFGFSFIFMVQSAITIYIYYYFSHFLGPAVAIPLMIVSLLGLAGTIMLFRFMKQ
ncbi:hypothetical protein [Ferroplasma sp.]|uniref:hypothetical protein n=1 Tax=Ferroplasma sp. TaxID=2591003 RepID=UPI00307D6475